MIVKQIEYGLLLKNYQAGNEDKYLYIIRTSPPDQIFQLTVPSNKLLNVMPSPEVQGLAPDTPISPEYAPESPDYSPRLPASTEQLQEDNYDYDTEDEYGFYDPGPANLEEIIKEYEESRKKMKDDDENDEDNDDDEDENENENEDEMKKR